MKEETEPLLFVGLASVMIGVSLLPLGLFAYGFIFWGSLFIFFSIIFNLRN